MVKLAAKTVKFIPFVAMIFFGATSFPRLLFLVFLPGGLDFPEEVERDLLESFAMFIVVVAGFIGISSWLRKKEDVF